ncbi:MAG: hypothetical protein L6R40_000031 [Gallowayella cf. fulva]|nr:MAG: hypothetical protein L6R40_000031 [Xanthomendoza cf. fulva]
MAVWLIVYLFTFAHCLPAAPSRAHTVGLTQGPDLSPLVYHIPNTHNTLYIQLHDYPLPPVAFAFTIREARGFIRRVTRDSHAGPDTRLPPDKDPFEYPPAEPMSPVTITWESRKGYSLTWGILAVAMKGLDDCLVKNNQLPWLATWHIFDEDQGGEVGRGVVGRGKGKGKGKGYGGRNDTA